MRITVLLKCAKEKNSKGLTSDSLYPDCTIDVSASMEPYAYRPTNLQSSIRIHLDRRRLDIVVPPKRMESDVLTV